MVFQVIELWEAAGLKICINIVLIDEFLYYMAVACFVFPQNTLNKSKDIQKVNIWKLFLMSLWF